MGNLEDLTFRAARVLQEVAVIAAEDTRRTRKLLGHYNLATPVISYREQNHDRVLPRLLKILKEGRNAAVVSDAGTPLVSDPGALLVKDACREGIKIVPVPGPSALACALSAAGLPASSFVFLGFLPAKKTARRKIIEEVKTDTRTIVFFEAPHRLIESLRDASDILGPREAVLCREMTKRYEEFLRRDLTELAREAAERGQSIRGEITVVVAGALKKDAGLTREELINIIRGDKRPVKEIAADLAEVANMGRSELYRLILEITRVNNDEIA